MKEIVSSACAHVCQSLFSALTSCKIQNDACRSLSYISNIYIERRNVPAATSLLPVYPFKQSRIVGYESFHWAMMQHCHGLGFCACQLRQWNCTQIMAGPTVRVWGSPRQHLPLKLIQTLCFSVYFHFASLKCENDAEWSLFGKPKMGLSNYACGFLGIWTCWRTKHIIRIWWMHQMPSSRFLQSLTVMFQRLAVS